MLENLTTRIEQAVESGAYAEEETLDGLSFYALTKLLNTALSHYDLGEVTMQYVRNLAMSGRIDGQKRTSMKGVRFTDEQAEEFIVRFVARRLSTNK